MSHKRIHCCKSRFSSRGNVKGPQNNIPPSTLVQWSNNVVIWTDIPLFTSPFFRDSYCLYPFWNSSRSKNLVVKTTWFCSTQCYTQNETIPPKSGKKAENCLFEFSCSLSLEGCDARCDVPVMRWGRNLAIGFFDKNKPLFSTFIIYVYVFFGELGFICMISICVADNQLWLLWLNDSYHYECRLAIMTIWPIFVWLSSELRRISVCDYWLTAISVNVWPYQCMSGNQSMYVLAYIQSYVSFFLSFITQIILFVFLVVK